MRRTVWFWLVLIGCNAEEGGCGSDYPYPRDLPAAVATQQAMRGRITQSGLDAAMRGFSDVLAAACSLDQSDGAPCTVDASPARVRFFLGSPGDPVSFSSNGFAGSLRAGGPYPHDVEFDTNCLFSNPPVEARPYCDDTGGATCAEILARGTGTTGSGFCRAPGSSGCNSPGDDWCCGAAAPNLCAGDYAIAACTAPRSSIGFSLSSLDDNLHLGLVQDSQGGGLRITIGCDEDQFSNCTDDTEFVRGSMDLVAYGAIFGNDLACYYQDHPDEDAAFIIKSMRFVVKPNVVIGEDGRPYIEIDDSQITVERFHFELLDNIADGPALSDPACYDEGWSALNCSVSSGDDNFSDCDLCPGAPTFLSDVLSGVLGEALAETVADVLVEQFADQALDAAGPMDMSPIFPDVPAQLANVDYLVAASDNSPYVTGPTQAGLGMNVDLDVGFYGPHSPCVPAIVPPAWDVISAPDPGTTVMAPDPVTGELQSEAFDFALIASDVAVDRAAYALYDGGALCIGFTGEQIGELSGGAFVPTVGMLSLLASGLADFAPEDAPVDIRLSPKAPPLADFGTGAGEGETRDSHLKLAWSDLQVDLYPLEAEANMRALAVSFDLQINLSLAATPRGAVQLIIDKLTITNVQEAYNEMGLLFDAAGVGSLIAAFLPSLLTGEPIEVPLSSDALGFPLVPKFRAVELMGFEGRHLALFFKLCPGPDLEDENNPLCYEGGGGRDVGSRLAVAALGEPGADDVWQVDGALELVAHSDLPDMELLVRVDGIGPPFAFAPGADGRYHVWHPVLAWGGRHELSIVGRSTSRPGLWTDAVALSVDVTNPVVRPSVEAPLVKAPAVEPEASGDGCAAAGSGSLAMLLPLVAYLGVRARRRRAA